MPNIAVTLYGNNGRGGCMPLHTFHYSGSVVWTWNNGLGSFDAVNTPSSSDDVGYPSAGLYFGSLFCTAVWENGHYVYKWTFTIWIITSLCSPGPGFTAYKTIMTDALCPEGTFTGYSASAPTDCSSGTLCIASFPATTVSEGAPSTTTAP
jgi:hypothetical protein